MRNKRSSLLHLDIGAFWFGRPKDDGGETNWLKQNRYEADSKLVGTRWASVKVEAGCQNWCILAIRQTPINQ